MPELEESGNRRPLIRLAHARKVGTCQFDEPKPPLKQNQGSILKTRSDSGQQVAYGHWIDRRQAEP